jgi:hypothetical protein
MQQIDDSMVGLLAAFPFDALAVVIELRGFAEQTIVDLVSFGLERSDFWRLRGVGRLRRFGRVGCCR